MELTKEYLDKQFKLNQQYFSEQNKLTREHLDNKFILLESKFDDKFEKFEKRWDKKLNEKLDQKLDQKLDEKLAIQTLAITTDLKNYVHESFETQQVYLDERFKELIHGMRVKVDFPSLKRR